MHLFIDANIFLDFYHLTSVDLEELRKLVALIEDGTITLYSNEQLKDEIERNRDTKIADAMSHLEKAASGLKMTFPAFCKAYPEYNELREMLKQANGKHAELYKKALDDVAARNLGADKLIGDILSKANQVPLTEKIFTDSIRRLRLGNPPGKKKVTMGDEVNWETLLGSVPSGNDLFLVSGDSDYASPFNKEEVAAFLQNEWNNKKGGRIVFYRSIADFLKANFPKIKIASDVRTMRLIEGLAASKSFAMTHLVIGQLGTIDEFSIAQAEELVDILFANNQVNWIIEDTDVRDFYSQILDRHGARLESKKRDALEAALKPPDTTEQPWPEDDEIPF